MKEKLMIYVMTGVGLVFLLFIVNYYISNNYLFTYYITNNTYNYLNRIIFYTYRIEEKLHAHKSV